jgi:hypothetical protein
MSETLGEDVESDRGGEGNELSIEDEYDMLEGSELNPWAPVETIHKPITKETYAIVVKGKQPGAYEVTQVIDDDVTFTSTKSNDTFKARLDEGALLRNTSDYTILDIERVVVFEMQKLTKDQSSLGRLTSDIIQDLDISLAEIKDKDIIYTSTELREELLSSLIKIYDAYEKPTMITQINNYINHIFTLLTIKDKEYLYSYERGKSFPPWLLPIVDNPTKRFTNIVSEESEINESYEVIRDINELQDAGTAGYYQVSRGIMDALRPMNPSLSDNGYLTQNIRYYLRDCVLSASCIGYNGNYIFDKRSNKLPYLSNSQVSHKPDTLNIVGVLYIPDNHMIQCPNVLRTSTISLLQKVILQKAISHRYYNIIQLRNQVIRSQDLDRLDEGRPDEGRLTMLTSYLFNERLTEGTFYEHLTKLTPSPVQVLDELSDTVKDKLLNYEDINLVFIKYKIDISRISKESRLAIDQLLTRNYKQYLRQIKRLPKITVTYKKQELTYDYKIHKSKELIFAMNSIAKRNEYLQSFIQLFSREPLLKEDAHTLYNVYTNEYLLCKHYLYSSIYHTNKDAHQTMLSIYGRTPEDGVIYCKRCGEYLCEEEFSSFDGFINEAPIQIREVMVSDTNLTDEFKEEMVLLVKQIASSWGVTIKDEDIHYVLTIYNTLNQDKLISIRYGTHNITETHPMIDGIKAKHAKDKHKKERIKHDMKQLQVFFKDTNKLLSLLSLVVLTIQTSIPSYKNKFNYKFNYIEFSDISLQNLSFVPKVIDYCTVKLSALAKSSRDPLWQHYTQLFSEEKLYDVAPVSTQIHNIIQTFISPQFDSVQQRILQYITFTSTISYKYIRDEWTLFKPLRNNKEVLAVDEFIQSKDEQYKPHYILTYNNYPIENISMIQPLSSSKDTFIREVVNIPVSEIMINKSFLLIFKLALSNYGTYKGSSARIHLHIDRFLDTIKQRDTMAALFTKHGYSKDKHISYKQLRTSILPDIINHYQKDRQLLETCFSDSKICNRFIHINMNNYDYCMVQTKPKRYYSYTPPCVYPRKDFEDLSEEFIDKIFRRYCTDPASAVIQSTMNIRYLGKVLITEGLTVELPDQNECELPLTKDKENFTLILKAIQSASLSPALYIEPVVYSMEQYTQDILNQYIESEQMLLQVFQKNSHFELPSDHPLFQSLTSLLESNLHKVSKDAVKRTYEKSFSDISIDEFVIEISSFIQQITSKPHQKRFENIFINTSDSINLSSDERTQLEGDNFRYRNLRESDIAKILLFFSNDKRLTSNLVTKYVYHLQFVLARLANKATMYSHIPKQWKLSETNTAQFKQYSSANAMYLYQDLFKSQPTYTGYRGYLGTHRYVYQALSKYIEPFTHNLNRLHITQDSIIDSNHMLMVNRFIFMFILHKLVEFRHKVAEHDQEVTSLLEEYIDSEEELHIPTVEEALEHFIMDYITDIFQMHYDSKWVVSNTNLDNLTKRLSKQKEKEKQGLIHKLDTMSDEKRTITMEKQKMGINNFFKTSGQENVSRVVDEYTHSTDDERYSIFNNLVGEDTIIADVSGVYNGDLNDNPGEVLPDSNEEGYMDQHDIDEDGQMGDELHEFHDEDLLDNDFN